MKQKDYCQLALAEILKLDNVRSDGEWLYFYDNTLGAWIQHDSKQARRKIRQILKEAFKDVNFTVSEIKMIEAELQELPELYKDFTAVKNEKWINTNSGMVDLDTLEVSPHDKSFYETTCLDFKFHSNATWHDVPIWSQYIATSWGENTYGPKARLLLQILVYTVSNLHGAKKMFTLVGKPHSGKSTLIKFIRRIAGTGGYMPLGLTDLSDRFRSGLLERAHLVLNDELPCTGVKNLDMLKKIIAEEDIIIESKGKAPKCFTPKIKLVYAGNQLPKSNDYDFGNAFADRLCILVFPRSLKRESWNLNLDEKVFEERDAIMSLAVKKAKELIESNYSFAVPVDSIKILDNYKKESASVQTFIEDQEVCQLGPEYKDHLTNLYEAYKTYASENALAPVSRWIFRQQLFMIDGIELVPKFRLPGTSARAGAAGIQLKNSLLFNNSERRGIK